MSLRAATVPTRELYGGGVKGMAASSLLVPGATERAMAAHVIPRTHGDKPPLPHERNVLYHPSERLAERGDSPGHVQKMSADTGTASRSGQLGLGLLAGGVAAALWRLSRRA